VVFDGREIRRDRGLPQGIPVSPLLANLYLDEFDDQLLGRDFRLVRYADNFVVLTRDLESARAARQAAHEALAALRLDLNEDDTALRSLDDGFTYLGYLFCRSVVLETDKSEEPPAPEPLAPGDVPAASWLAQVPFRRLAELVADRAGRESPAPADRRGEVAVVPLAGASGPPAPATRPLYVASPEARLHLSGATLRIEGLGEEALELPLRGLSHVVFLGRTRATVPLLLTLARFGVPSFFCRPSGELAATFGPHHPDWHVWGRQARLAEGVREGGEAVRLAFAREVIAAKLHNSATLAVRFAWQNAAEVAEELRQLARAAANKTDVESLLGLEGRGAAVAFRALAASLPAGWGFAGRVKQPPRDPVNAMLSFGYTLLHHHAATALTLRGLNPQVGLLHQGRGTHQALASDLQEEVRWLVDALVWSLIRRREVAPEDFTASPDGRYPCLLSPTFRRRFVDAFEERLATPFTPPGGGEALSYREFLSRQAFAIRRLVLGETATYSPLRLHA
jgi:CRISPR-associated protein Cas1